MVKRFEIGQSAAKHLAKGDEGSTTSQSILRCFSTMEKWPRMPGLFFGERITRYSLNLWETIRSKDKEPYDNKVWAHTTFPFSPSTMAFLR